LPGRAHPNNMEEINEEKLFKFYKIGLERLFDFVSNEKGDGQVKIWATPRGDKIKVGVEILVKKGKRGLRGELVSGFINLKKNKG